MAKKYTSKKRSAKLDQFYTNPYIAKLLFQKVKDKIPQKSRLIYLEPSAGSGSFSDLFENENKFCFDLDPKKDYIVKKDFFDVASQDINNTPSENVCVIGNPPFGKNASLAVKFFNHSAELANTIAFVVPKTFKKQSIHNKLNLKFRLIYQEDLPRDSFLFDDDVYDVPCVFQIWIKSKKSRAVVKSPNNCDLFEFVKKENANFAIRRAGGRAGTAFEDVSKLSEQSNHFCKTTGKMTAKQIVELINGIDFSKVANSTAGVRSVSKGEVIRAIEGKTK